MTGEPARKVGGSYEADGWILSRFKTRTGQDRVVFEFAHPTGMLHIFNPTQLMVVDRADGAERRDGFDDLLAIAEHDAFHDLLAVAQTLVALSELVGAEDITARTSSLVSDAIAAIAKARA